VKNVGLSAGKDKHAMSIIPPSLAAEADYAWELATLYPPQGAWSEDAYLDLTDGTNRRIELVDGRLEFLPMPTEMHQALVGFLYHALLSFVTKHDLGIVPYAPLRVRVPGGRYREPDVMFLRKENFHLRSNRIWKGADLLMEIVSGDPKDRKRDYEDKLADYIATNVAEYWIVDPERRTVTVHRLAGEGYTIHAEFCPGQTANSALLPGFAIDVAALFAVENHVAD
jgi:Uma2 family endonuclease